MKARAVPRAAVVLVALGGMLASASRANELHLGAAAPPAVLVTLDGHRIATADLMGQVVILTFWATWCVPCRQELPLLSAYAQAHAAQGLTVLAFSLDTPEDLARVREVARNYQFPAGLMALSSAPGYGRIWHIPVNFTIDRQGVLIDDGWKDKHPVWTAERLERLVTPLLATAR
jgi:cytochrome c biogenesis protein CcmG/thiol:disulfide interchange protein DsbE